MKKNFRLNQVAFTYVGTEKPLWCCESTRYQYLEATISQLRGKPYKELRLKMKLCKVDRETCFTTAELPKRGWTSKDGMVSHTKFVLQSRRNEKRDIIWIKPGCWLGKKKRMVATTIFLACRWINDDKAFIYLPVQNAWLVKHFYFPNGFWNGILDRLAYAERPKPIFPGQNERSSYELQYCRLNHEMEIFTVGEIRMKKFITEDIVADYMTKLLAGRDFPCAIAQVKIP